VISDEDVVVAYASVAMTRDPPAAGRRLVPERGDHELMPA